LSEDINDHIGMKEMKCRYFSTLMEKCSKSHISFKVGLQQWCSVYGLFFAGESAFHYRLQVMSSLIKESYFFAS